MKKNLAILLFLLVILLTGCAEKPAEHTQIDSPAKEIEDYITATVSETTAKSDVAEEEGEENTGSGEIQVEALETEKFDMEAFRAYIGGLTQKQVYADNEHALFSHPIACQYGDYTLYLQKVSEDLWGLVCRKNDGTEKKVLYTKAGLDSVQCVNERTVLLQGGFFEESGYPTYFFIFYDLISGKEVDYPLPEAVGTLENVTELIFLDRGIVAHTATYVEYTGYTSSYFIDARGEVHFLVEALNNEAYDDGFYYYGDNTRHLTRYCTDLTTMEECPSAEYTNGFANKVVGKYFWRNVEDHEITIEDLKTGDRITVLYEGEPLKCDLFENSSYVYDGNLYIYLRGSYYTPEWNGLYRIDLATGEAQFIAAPESEHSLHRITIADGRIYCCCYRNDDHITYRVSSDGSGLTLLAEE